MSAQRTTIISVGANPELVRLRNFVLREAGFNVVSTLDEHDALARIERKECGLLLMCYSLPDTVRKKLAEALRSFCPGSRIVAVANKHVEQPFFGTHLFMGWKGRRPLLRLSKLRWAQNREAPPR